MKYKMLILTINIKYMVFENKFEILDYIKTYISVTMCLKNVLSLLQNGHVLFS